MITNTLLSKMEVENFNKNNQLESVIQLNLKTLQLEGRENFEYYSDGKVKRIKNKGLVRLYKYNDNITNEDITNHGILEYSNIYINNLLIYQYDILNDLLSIYEYNEDNKPISIIIKDIETDKIIFKTTATYKNGNLKERKVYSIDNNNSKLKCSMKQVYTYKEGFTKEKTILPKLKSTIVNIISEEGTKITTCKNHNVISEQHIHL